MSKRTIAINEITLKTWAREAKVFVDSTFAGRVYVVHDEDIVLYPISVMAAAIGRDRETLIGWEKAGMFPKSKWGVPDKRTKRWYSRAQIVEAHSIHWELCEGDYGFSVSRHFPLPEFFKRIKATFHKIDGITKKRTT